MSVCVPLVSPAASFATWSATSPTTLPSACWLASGFGSTLRWNHWQYLQAPNARKSQPTSEIAWRGWHPQQLNVQVLAYGLDNPHPEREIERVVLSASEGSAVWRVFGVTLCDAPVYFAPSPISFGIPDNWGAAAVV